MVNREQAIAELERRRGVRTSVSREDAIAELKRRRGAEPSFLERTATDLEGRGAKVADIIQARGKGEQSIIETAGQFVGQEIGAATDVVGNIIANNPLIESISDVSQVALEKFSRTDIGEKALDALQAGGKAIDKFSKENPRAARNIEAIINIGGAAGSGITTPTARGVAQATRLTGNVLGEAIQDINEGAKAAKNFGPEVARGLKARAIPELENTSQVLREVTSKSYQEFRDLGATIRPQKISEVPGVITKVLTEGEKLNNRLHKKTLSVLKDLNKDIADGKVSLEELDQSRRLFSTVAQDVNQVGRATEDARKATQAIRGIDDFIDSLQSVDVVGGRKAIDVLKRARGEAATAFKFDKISNIIIKADGDPAKIKSGFTRFVDKKKNLKGFSPQEIDALRAASRNTGGEKLLRAFGKFGFDLGTSTSVGNTALPALTTGAAAAGLGTAPLVLGGTAARVGQKGLARGRAENVLKIIEGQ